MTERSEGPVARAPSFDRSLARKDHVTPRERPAEIDAGETQLYRPVAAGVTVPAAGQDETAKIEKIQHKHFKRMRCTCPHTLSRNHTGGRARARALARTHARTHAHTHARTHAHTHAHTHTHTQRRARVPETKPIKKYKWLNCESLKL